MKREKFHPGETFKKIPCRRSTGRGNFWEFCRTGIRLPFVNQSPALGHFLPHITEADVVTVILAVFTAARLLKRTVETQVLCRIELSTQPVAHPRTSGIHALISHNVSEFGR